MEGILKNDLLVVDFFAPWCGPCKQIMPQLERVAESWKKAGVTLVKINVENANLTEYIQWLRVKSVPTFVFFRGGHPVGEVRGANFDQVVAGVLKYLEKNVPTT
jgi:putative thioredoxin